MKELFEKILKEINKIKIDSREVKEGDLFIALKGEKTHGAFFTDDALKRGARLCILPEEFKNKFHENEKIIFVKDTLEFLTNLAKLKREKTNAKIIGLTGSVGKTTTKFMISHLLKKAGKKVYPSPKSYNNFIGVSLTLLNAPSDAEFIIQEMGINQKGEMEKLSKIVKPHIGILTKIGPSHLEGLESIEKVAEEKSKLFKYLPSDGFAIINKNSPFYEKIETRANKVFYKLEESNLRWDGKNFIYENEFKFKIPVPSFGMAENALCALKTAFILKISIPDNPFDDFKFPELRMEIKNLNNSIIILDAYNANPVSMEDVIKSSTFFNKKEKYLFMGDMLELGEHSETYHREIARILKAKEFNAVFTYGEYSRYTGMEAEKLGIYSLHFNDKKKMKEKLLEISNKEAVIVIKGSRRMEMETLLEGLDAT